MAIPNLRKIFASFRTNEDEAEFGRRALYNLVGFIGSVVALPVPSKSVRFQLEDRQWTSCVASWVSITQLVLRLSDQDFVHVLEADSMTAFALSFMRESCLEQIDTLSDGSRRLAVQDSLMKNTFLLVVRMISTQHCPSVLRSMDFIANFIQVFGKRNRALLRDAIEQFSEANQDVFLETLSDSYVCHNAAKVAGLCSIVPSIVSLVASSHLAKALLASYGEPDQDKSAMRHLAFLIMINDSCPLKFLDTMLAQPETSALVSDLVKHSTFLDRLQQASRARPGVQSLVAGIIEKRLRSADISDEFTNNESEEHLAETMSKVSQLQDLFPDLSDSYIKACLTEYDQDLSLTTMQILEGNIPDHIKEADEQLKEGKEASSLPTSDHSTVTRRENIYDDDDFDRLVYDKGQVRSGRRLSDNADALLRQSLSLEQKVKVLSLAYDPDDDELDDTYDEFESLPAIDHQTNDDLADSLGTQVPSVDDILFLTFESNPGVYEISQRKSRDRQDLRAKTNLSDEQIEGWKVMLVREPARARKLAEKHAFQGQQQELKSGKWASAKTSGAHGTDKGRGGRGGSHDIVRGSGKPHAERTPEQIKRDRARKEIRGSVRGRGRGRGVTRGQARPQG